MSSRVIFSDSKLEVLRALANATEDVDEILDLLKELGQLGHIGKGGQKPEDAKGMKRTLLALRNIAIEHGVPETGMWIFPDIFKNKTALRKLKLEDTIKFLVEARLWKTHVMYASKFYRNAQGVLQVPEFWGIAERYVKAEWVLANQPVGSEGDDEKAREPSPVPRVVGFGAPSVDGAGDDGALPPGMPGLQTSSNVAVTAAVPIAVTLDVIPPPQLPILKTEEKGHAIFEHLSMRADRDTPHIVKARLALSKCPRAQLLYVVDRLFFKAENYDIARSYSHSQKIVNWIIDLLSEQPPTPDFYEASTRDGKCLKQSPGWMKELRVFIDRHGLLRPDQYDVKPKLRKTIAKGGRGKSADVVYVDILEGLDERLRQLSIACDSKKVKK